MTTDADAHESGPLVSFATSVAETVAGPQASDEFGVDWTSLIELVMQIVSSLMENCSARDSKVVQAIKKPGLFQRARFKAQVHGHCQSCYTYRWRDQSGNIAEAMLKKAAEMSDAELAAVVFESRNDDWILV